MHSPFLKHIHETYIHNSVFGTNIVALSLSTKGIYSPLPKHKYNTYMYNSVLGTHVVALSFIHKTKLYPDKMHLPFLKHIHDTYIYNSVFGTNIVALSLSTKNETLSRYQNIYTTPICILPFPRDRIPHEPDKLHSEPCARQRNVHPPIPPQP